MKIISGCHFKPTDGSTEVTLSSTESRSLLLLFDIHDEVFINMDSFQMMWKFFLLSIANWLRLCQEGLGLFSILGRGGSWTILIWWDAMFSSHSQHIEYCTFTCWQNFTDSERKWTLCYRLWRKQFVKLHHFVIAFLYYHFLFFLWMIFSWVNLSGMPFLNS